MNESGAENLVEVLRWIGQVVGYKGTLIQEIQERLGINIPKYFTYKEVLDLIVKKGLEKEFCEAFLSKPFAANNLNEAYDKYTVSRGLSMLDKSEVACLAKRLSNGGTKWKYDRYDRTDMIRKILAKASRYEIESALTDIMAKGDTTPFVRQTKKCIIGPLGISLSVESRGADAHELVDILEAYVGDKRLSDFVQLDPSLKKQFPVNGGDPLRLTKFIQEVLTLKRTDEILATLNGLIADSLIDITSYDIEKHFLFVVTPCGIFRREYNGTENLCQLLLQEIDPALLEQSLRAKYKASSLELRVLDKCIRENPDDILQELFGRPQLFKVGANLGLVKMVSLDNAELARFIALRLGFTLPPRIEGLTLLIRKIEEGRRKISSDTVDESTKRGVTIEALQGVEHVLKELAYFYVAFLWKDEFAGVYEADETRDKISEIIKREFKMARSGGLTKFTLGMLIDLLRKMNSTVMKDSNLRQKVRSYLKKDSLFSETAIDLISQANASSPHMKHADEAGKPVTPLDLTLCDNFLANIAGALSILKKERGFPTIIRVRREVQDEYSRRYIIAIDDDGEEWTVKSDTWLEPERAYYMYSETRPVAVSPLIIEKIF